MPKTSGNNSVVECDLAKVEVAGSNPVSRSKVNMKILKASSKNPCERGRLARIFEQITAESIPGSIKNLLVTDLRPVRTGRNPLVIMPGRGDPFK